MAEPLTPGEQARYDQLIETVKQSIARTMFHHATPAMRLHAASMLKTDLAGEDWSVDLLRAAIESEPLIHFESIPGAFLCVSEMFKDRCPHRCNHAAGEIAIRAGMLMFAEATSETRNEAIARLCEGSRAFELLLDKAKDVPLLTVELEPGTERDVFALSPDYITAREALEALARTQDADDGPQAEQDTAGE